MSHTVTAYVSWCRTVSWLVALTDGWQLMEGAVTGDKWSSQCTVSTSGRARESTRYRLSPHRLTRTFCVWSSGLFTVHVDKLLLKFIKTIRVVVRQTYNVAVLGSTLSSAPYPLHTR